MDARKAAFRRDKLAQFSEFLQVLADSHHYALDLDDSPSAFAVPINEAENLGARQHDLRWLVRCGWIQHLASGHAERPYGERECGAHGQFANARDISPESRFIITDAGLDATSQTLPVYQDGNDESVYPSWHAERHELTIHGRVVKRFRWPAANQETVLIAFQEEGWPPRIDDPLPQIQTLDPKRRLSDTIKCLNRNQVEKMIRFRGDGTGEGVLWDLVLTPAKPVASYSH